jgi:hypothetical protein
VRGIAFAGQRDRPRPPELVPQRRHPFAGPDGNGARGRAPPMRAGAETRSALFATTSAPGATKASVSASGAGPRRRRAAADRRLPRGAGRGARPPPRSRRTLRAARPCLPGSPARPPRSSRASTTSRVVPARADTIAASRPHQGVQERRLCRRWARPRMATTSPSRSRSPRPPSRGAPPSPPGAPAAPGDGRVQVGRQVLRLELDEGLLPGEQAGQPPVHRVERGQAAFGLAQRCRRWAAVSAAIRSATPSAAVRSSLPWTKARRVNSPASAGARARPGLRPRPRPRRARRAGAVGAVLAGVAARPGTRAPGAVRAPRRFRVAQPLSEATRGGGSDPAKRRTTSPAPAPDKRITATAARPAPVARAKITSL